MRRPHGTEVVGILLLLVALPVSAAFGRQGIVYSQLPERIDAKTRYVIYLHGRIVEEQGRRPTHETLGVYEYQKILDTLAAGGLTVISEQRPRDTDMDQFASHVADQVRKLLAAGVPPEHVSVVGFSKGGGIAMRASALLKNDRVNFVFLASCGGADDMDVQGRILSIYEASDEAGRSCAALFARSRSQGEHKEIKISTGEGHGAFYRPRQEWIAPVLRWVTGPPGGRGK